MKTCAENERNLTSGPASIPSPPSEARGEDFPKQTFRALNP
jgi:hypothetical protein